MGVVESQRDCRGASLFVARVAPAAAWAILTVLTACQPDKIAAADPDAVAAWEAAMRDAGREPPAPAPPAPVSTSPNEAGAEGQTPPVTSVDPTTAIGGQSGGAAAPATPPANPCSADAGPCASDAGLPPVVCVPTGPRDCTSALDNDCDGQLDNVVDDVCQCVPGTIEVCDEHPGLDGLGSCVAGSRACVAGEGNATSAFDECSGSVAPAAEDICAPGDDSNCNGVPNEGCICVEGETQACGSTTDTGVCQIGSTTCVNGAFGECQGAVAPAARDTCAPGDDSNCNGVANEGCTCVDGDTQPCGQDVGVCQAGTQTCTNGTFGQCVGAIGPTQRDCTSANDNDCDGRPDNTIDNVCRCEIGETQACDTHPQDGVGACRAGEQRCVAGPNNSTSAFGQTCTGSVGPGPRSCGSNADNDCDGEPDDTIDEVCECSPAQGNEACSDDASNSRCNAQGQCVPCQTDGDCSLVAGGQNLCGGGQCFASEAIVGWRIRGDSATLPATSGVPGVTGSDMTKSTAFAPVAALQDTFGAIDWPTDGLDTRRFFEFGVTANPGSSVTFDHLEFSISSANADGGSADWQIRSSLDSFASAIAQGSASELALPGTAVAPNVRDLGTRTGTVTFRLYIFNIASDEVPAVGIRGSNGAGASSLLIFGAVN